MKHFLLSILLAGAFLPSLAEGTKIKGIKGDTSFDVYYFSSVSDIRLVNSGGEKTFSIVNGKDTISGYSALKFIADEGVGTSAKDMYNDGSVYVYPNPIAQTITIVGADETTDLTLVDSKGNVACKTKGSKMDVENLPKGIYVLIAGDTKVKIIKN